MCSDEEGGSLRVLPAFELLLVREWYSEVEWFSRGKWWPFRGALASSG